MALNTAYFVLLFAGLGFMLAQSLVKQKKLEHLFFAIFCGSMALVAAEHLSADKLGAYQYLIGFGACATCNAMWLVSKSMFSGEESISKRHILFAVLISVLVILNNSVETAYQLSSLTSDTYVLLGNGLGEIINLLSSTVLALTFWEAFKGISTKLKQEFWQRILFMASFCIGITLCLLVAKTFFSPQALPQVMPWLVAISAIQIMLTTQVILWWKQYSQIKQTAELETPVQDLGNETLQVEQSLITGLNTLLNKDKRYLTPNLKMIDLANELKVSEYKISRAIRYHFEAPNFNHFINSFRVEHAKNLLEQPESQHWTILVVALESGFSSLATFNRVFKMQLGYAPNEHRKGAHVRCIKTKEESLVH